MAAPRGRPPKTERPKYKCVNCEREIIDSNFYSPKGKLFSNIGRIPVCKDCIRDLYDYYYEKYKSEYYSEPEKKAVKRICMTFDIYFSDKAYKETLNEIEKNPVTSHISAYMKVIHKTQYTRDKQNYDTTIREEEDGDIEKDYLGISKELDVDEKVIEFFGAGFSEEDYKFLDKEYQDWTARHECETKAQEEIFKRICFKQLEILKATRAGESTKVLDEIFQDYLDAAKLKPKQNSGDTTADTQTFGTLIDKWENTRPLPEIDEELKDVDKIALYINIFFKGHLSKMMGLKNGLSNLYTKYMKQYTVEKPEYDDDEDSEVLFDAIFGKSLSDVSDSDNKGVT